MERIIIVVFWSGLAAAKLSFLRRYKSLRDSHFQANSGCFFLHWMTKKALHVSFLPVFFSVVGTLVRPACGRSSHEFSLLVETRDFPLSGVFLRSNCRKPWSRSLLLLSDQELQQQRVSCAVVILFARFAFTNYWWLAVASADEEEEKIVCTMQSDRQGGGRTVG